ncbi:hypothetical protein L6452_43465 [Arctium lappa]|uniref:Uncharacterized protein n=1 Tax=Arctium lappa TaxID=4217 RepID=A0ACB8XE61_ARCLA|nr:hypothetical protein L6452_43465 [Arctium lappa]
MIHAKVCNYDANQDGSSSLALTHSGMEQEKGTIITFNNEEALCRDFGNTVALLVDKYNNLAEKKPA